MPGTRFLDPYVTVIDAAGVPIPGAELNFYLAGSSTRAPTYADLALTVPNTNPVIADDGGMFPAIFLDQVISYKAVLTTASIPGPPVIIWTADNVAGPISIVAQNSATTASQVRANITGDNTSDLIQATEVVPMGAPLTGYNAFAGYVQNNDSGGGGTSGNGVVYYGVSAANAPNAAVWGMNLIVTDSLNTSVISATAGDKVIGIEIDIGITSPGSVFEGLSFLGSCVSQPSFAAGVSLGELSIQNPGVAKWSLGFSTSNGVLMPMGSAFSAGAAAYSGSNIASQPYAWSYFNAAGAAQNYQMKVAANGAMQLNGSDASPQLAVNGLVFALDGFDLGTVAASGANIAGAPIIFNYFDAAGAAQNFTLGATSTGSLAIVGTATHPVVSVAAMVGVAGGLVVSSGSALPVGATSGFLYLPAINGAPTGVPEAQAGSTAAAYDTTNNKIWVYNGSWKSITLT